MASYVSRVAKDGNILPLTISHWTQMPAIFVLNAMSEVKKVFDYPDDLNDWIRGRLHDRWKSHKHSVKKEGFYKYKTQEERLAHRPKFVVESQWGPLIEYWQNPHQDAKCAKNKASKSKQTVQQSSGSKPHVKYAAELEAKLKRPPTAQEIYDATHAKRKKQMDRLEDKPSRHSSESSSAGQNGAVVQLKGQDCMKQMEGLENKPRETRQRAGKVRGPTTLKFLDTLRPGQRLQVESWLNSPIGPNSTYISRYVSHLAKDGNKLPLTISHWKRMPAVFVLNAISEVK
ncbi:hypothetical protein MKW94_023843, partial [Papaver nudicaule]|nr:hypothetical protein [Papaver nudicaule]